ncbi:MAG: lysylphosphatidylglycerol synthase transmembrane domain-containing protein [bacterium]|nr:lysylphosphatidylglycerol synthase transmembrane domain-containing protein [bacterium]
MKVFYSFYSLSFELFGFYMKDKKIWIGLIISLICIVYFVTRSGFDWHKIWQVTKSAEYLWFIPATIIFIFSFYLRAVRWQIFMAPIQYLPVKRLIPSLMIGFMGNSVLPARLGELIRPYVLGKKENISISAILATVVIERIFDFVCLFLLLGIVLLFLKPSSTAVNIEGISLLDIQKASYIFLIFVIGILVVSILLKKYPDKSIIGLKKIFGFLPGGWIDKLVRFIKSYINGLQILHQPKQIMLSIFYSFAVWIAVALEILFVQYAFHLGTVSLFEPIFIMGVIAFAVAIPSAPAYIGTYHVAGSIALQLLGKDPNIASSFAMILHASQVIPIIAIGFYYLWKEGLTLRDAMNQMKEGRPAA